MKPTRYYVLKFNWNLINPDGCILILVEKDKYSHINVCCFCQTKSSTSWIHIFKWRRSSLKRINELTDVKLTDDVEIYPPDVKDVRNLLRDFKQMWLTLLRHECKEIEFKEGNSRVSAVLDRLNIE